MSATPTSQVTSAAVAPTSPKHMPDAAKPAGRTGRGSPPHLTVGCNAPRQPSTSLATIYKPPRFRTGGRSLSAMQRPIPCGGGRTWTASHAGRKGEEGCGGGVGEVVRGSAVAVVGRRGCCMCQVARRLLLWQGVNPVVCEVEEDRDEGALAEELSIGGRRGGAAAVQLPAVFIGGRHVGSLEKLMAVHLSGELLPLLREAGALWL